MKEISLGGKASYGLKETQNAANLGAVELLLITDSLIKKSRQEGDYSIINGMMKTVESGQGKIEIIDGTNPGGIKLDGLGGIGAILRYRI